MSLIRITAKSPLADRSSSRALEPFFCDLHGQVLATSPAVVYRCATCITHPVDTASEWINTAELCARLTCHRSTLQRIRDRALFLEGVHFIRKNPTATTGPLLWSLSKVEEAMRRSLPSQQQP